jgi:hypothetical protein
MALEILLWAVAISQVAIAAGFVALALALREIAKDFW